MSVTDARSGSVGHARTRRPDDDPAEAAPKAAACHDPTRGRHTRHRELDDYGNKPLFAATYTFPCLIGAPAMLSTGP